MVRMLITLEKPFGASDVMERMFITLDGPLEASEGISFLIKYNTPMGAVPGISYLMGIPLKSLDMVAISIILACGDH